MKHIASIGEILFDVFGNDEKLGGAPFNFLFHIIKLTGEGNFISRIGNDRLGEAVLEFFKSNKISTDFLQIDKSHPTGTANPGVNKEKNPSWVIKTGTAYDFIESNFKIKKLIDEKTSCLYFGTLAQREEISRDTIQSLLNRKVKYFYDLNIRQNFFSKDIIETSLKAANVVKFNLDELAIIKDLFFENNKNSLNQDKIAEALMKRFDIDLLCITMGGKGAVLYKENDSCFYHTNVISADIIDTVGAGDAYSAILCIGYLRDWDIKKTNKLASDFAAEIIKTKGAIPADDLIYPAFRKKIIE